MDRFGLNGRRVAGVVALAALLVAGLATPALAAVPTVTSFTPTSGPTGCVVTINGTNFTGVTAVSFGGTPAASFSPVSSTQLRATVAAGTTGVIQVTNADGPGSSSSSFTVASPGGCAPTISSFAPTSGPVGCGVTINGTNLFLTDTGTADVDFFGTNAVETFVSSTRINTTVPAGAADGAINVVTGVGTAIGASFDVNATSCLPTIISFSPTSGPPGTGVTITGTNLLGVTDVEFNGAAATFSSVSSTQITAIVPGAATTGPIDVTTGFGTGTSTTNFTVGTGPSPTITSFTPSSGPVGTSVTITGTNFSGTGFTTSSVTFNNTSATFTVNSSTQITATVPSGATTGAIRVTTPNGTATSSTNFTVTVAPLPTITGFSPTYGPTGTSVIITGTNFSGTGFTTSAVSFNNISATFTVNSATQITATVPSTGTTGRVRVTNPGGTATSTTDFVVSTVHSRTVSMDLIKHLVAKGQVSTGFTSCESGVQVKIQRWKDGGWTTKATATTSGTGSYKAQLPDKDGKYRAKAPKLVLGNGVDVCSSAASPSRKHND